MGKKYTFILESKTQLVLFTISVLVAGVCMNTSFADKDNNEKLSKDDVDVLCDASEDYEAHKKQCDKLYDMTEDDNDSD